MKPIDNHISWDNPYCDYIFLKFNKDVVKSDARNKSEMLIKPYTNPDNIVSTVLIESPEKGKEVSELEMLRAIVEDKDENAISLT